MLLEEFDVEKYERTMREDGEERFATLLQILMEEGRNDDISRAITDRKYREQLYQENRL